MASAVVIMNNKGKQLITRNYRQDVPYSTLESFVEKVIDEEESNVKPVFEVDGLTFAWISHNSLYFILVSKVNANATMLVTYLHSLYATLREYLGDVTEESIRDNFVVLYELLDEMMDFGYPQYTEPKLLQQYITQQGFKLKLAEDNGNPPELPSAVSGKSGSCPWRAEGLRYKKNEVFLEVIDHLNLLVNANGEILSSEVHGTLKMKVRLSGMPELVLRVNDKTMFDSDKASGGGDGGVVLDSTMFHPCVKVNKFATDKTINFVPPDGDFELMSYRMSTNKIKPLINIESQVEDYSGSRLEFFVKAKSQYKKVSSATGVSISIPVPADVDSPSFKASVGTVRYHPEQNTLEWTIDLFPGGKEFVCRASFGRPSIRTQDDFTRKPIKVKFELPYFTVSNFQVKHLKVVADKDYKALTWVRYFTRSGKYEIRMR
eukprot:TRINITY_DN29714_c0_g1_i1.p1 TRINITY_DN29714_c0_g1~~TRINITY_DN29714_c0_g1_i1.p1  ORF type:complete len:433 (+),score=174.82 TRINITY_DN29714_c0_g1_i1:111-1409(+)